jgi:hypothetical protein
MERGLTPVLRAVEPMNCNAQGDRGAINGHDVPKCSIARVEIPIEIYVRAFPPNNLFSYINSSGQRHIGVSVEYRHIGTPTMLEHEENSYASQSCRAITTIVDRETDPRRPVWKDIHSEAAHYYLRPMNVDVSLVGNVGLFVGGIGGGSRSADRFLAVANGASQVDDLKHQNSNLSEGSEYGYNAYSNRPSLVCVVAVYVFGMFGGALLGCVGALHFNHDRKRLGTSLIILGAVALVWSSVAFVLGLGLS